MTERVPGWLERVLLPRLSEIAGEIKAINARIEGLDKTLTTKIDELDRRLSENDRHLAEKIDDLDKRLNMAQRLAIVETKLGELQPKA